MTERSAKDVVEELSRRLLTGDDTVLDDLVAADMANHAAGPQGRKGLKRILDVIGNDLGSVTVEQHHLIGEGSLCRAAPHAARVAPGLHHAATRGPDRLPTSGGVDLHPHLAGRRRNDRRALGVPRRHGPAQQLRE